MFPQIKSGFRTKFQAVESEASKGSEVLKDKLDSIKEKVQEAIEEAGKSDIAKKAGMIFVGGMECHVSDLVMMSSSVTAQL